MGYRHISGRSLSGRHVEGRAIGMRASGGSASTTDGLIPGQIALEWDGDTADNRPDFDIIFYSGRGAPTDMAVGDILRIQKSATGASVWTAYLTHTVVQDDVDGVPFTVSGTSALSNATYDFRGRLERGTHIAPWSDIEQATVAAPAAPKNVIFVIRAG